MAYHASDPTLNTERFYVDTSQPLMGLGLGDAAVPDQNWIRIDYANSHSVGPTIAPYANDAYLARVQALQAGKMPPATWHLGPWIPSEGTVARAVELDRLSQGDAGMSLGMWLLAAVTGNLTGTPLFIVAGRTSTSDVLYAVTPEEFRALPAQTYFTVALPNNANPDPLVFQSLGVIYGPSQAPAPTGPATYPTTVPAYDWGSVFAPSASAGTIASWLTNGGGAATSTTTTPSPTSPPAPASAGMSSGTLLLLGAVVVGGYYLFKSGRL